MAGHHVHNHERKTQKHDYENTAYAKDAIIRHDRRHPDRKIAETGIFADIDLV